MFSARLEWEWHPQLKGPVFEVAGYPLLVQNLDFKVYVLYKPPPPPSSFSLISSAILALQYCNPIAVEFFRTCNVRNGKIFSVDAKRTTAFSGAPCSKQA